MFVSTFPLNHFQIVRALIWIVVGFIYLLSVPIFAQPGSEQLTSIDVFELEMATDPQISPDGSQVAYVRTSMDIMTDRGRSNIWLVNSDGSKHRPLFSGTENFQSPRWSPSGNQMAYLSNVAGRGTQLHVRWMDSGQTAMLTSLQESPASVTWSPDGSKIAFTMFVPAKGPTLAELPNKPKGAQWAKPVKVIDRLHYRQDGQGYLEVGNTHIFILPKDGGTPRQLTHGDFDHKGPLSWSPDGSRIAFSANRSQDYELQPRRSEIWTVELADGIISQLTNRVGPDVAPLYSLDGNTIAYLGFDDKKMGYHNTGVYLMDADGRNPRLLTKNFDRSIESVAWAGNAGGLYVSYVDHGDKHLAFLSIAGEIESMVQDLGGAITGRPYTSGGFSVSNNGTYAYSAGSAYRPAEVAVGNQGIAPKKLTSLNEDLLGHKDLGQVEELTWKSSTGKLEIQGWLVTPPDFDPNQQYPLLLEIHGGPFAAYGPHFSVELQLYAAAGYVVLYANPRGSTGYGYDFANEIHHNYPGPDYHDLMAGVDAVIAKGFIDESNLYVTGGSGGGVLTAWIIGKTNRFKAAVVAKPVINWVSHTLTADGSANFIQNWFPKAPWDDPDGYWKRSPLSLVGNVTTPTMLLTGEKDHRTPIAESEQYYQALKLQKVDAVMVRIPDASHGIASRPSQLIAKVDNILAWFQKYHD